MQGYTELLDLLKERKEAHGDNLPVDAYGSGEDLDDIKERAEQYGLAVSFLGARDHLDDSIHPYRCPCWLTSSVSAVCALLRAAILQIEEKLANGWTPATRTIGSKMLF